MHLLDYIIIYIYLIFFLRKFLIISSMVNPSLLFRKSMKQYPRCSTSFMCSTSGESVVGEILNTPENILVMMKEVSVGVSEAKRDNIRAVLVEIPLPITGGTELDDWPGGIKQKYSTLRPMLIETMKSLGFSATAIAARKYLGGGGGEEDAVGIWNDKDIYICCFPTVETIPILKTIIQQLETRCKSDTGRNNNDSIDIIIDDTTKKTGILVIVNQQFFLDPLSNQQSKDFLNDIPHGYILEGLNMKGPGALPVRGILYRQYPHSFKVRGLFMSKAMYVCVRYT